MRSIQAVCILLSLWSMIFTFAFGSDKVMTSRQFRNCSGVQEVVCTGSALDEDSKLLSLVLYQLPENFVIASVNVITRICVQMSEEYAACVLNDEDSRQAEVKALVYKGTGEKKRYQCNATAVSRTGRASLTTFTADVRSSGEASPALKHCHSLQEVICSAKSLRPDSRLLLLTIHKLPEDYSLVSLNRYKGSCQISEKYSSCGTGSSEIRTLVSNLRRGEIRMYTCQVTTLSPLGEAETSKWRISVKPVLARVVLLLNDAEENLTVTEHQPVDFLCQVSDRHPQVVLSLVKKDNSTALLSNVSSLHHVVVGRCEDSGQYVCAVDNDRGLNLTDVTRVLFVTCAPRRPYDVGEVTFVSDPVSLTFDVAAYPTPERLTFFYLGTSITDTQPMEISDSQIQLTGMCQPKPGVVYQSTCTVTVTSINTDTVSSFYQVTVTNRQGSGHFRFHVLCKGCGGSSGAESDAPSYLGFAVGVCVVLAVIIIIIVVVILVWRWRWALPCADTSNHTGPNDPTSSNSPARHTGPSNPIGGSDAVFTRNTMGSSIRSTSSAYDYPLPVQHPAEQTDTPHATGPRLPSMRLSDPSDYLHPIAGLAERSDIAHATGLRLQSMRLSDPSDYLHPIAGLVERADIAHATGLRLQSVTSRESETYLHPIPGPAD